MRWKPIARTSSVGLHGNTTNALLQTLQGKAMKTATAMEDDTEELNLLDLLPDWFECEMKEFRQMAGFR